MRFAIKTRPEHQTWAQIRDVWVAADEVELFESAWNWDHFYPLTEPYDGPNFEAWTMIAALAQATRRIRLGCQVTGMVYRHPAVLANMAATTDIISGGRLELGVGAGWNQMECDAYGIELPPLRERFDRFDEGVEAIIALLSQETVHARRPLRQAHRRAVRAQAGAAPAPAHHDRRAWPDQDPAHRGAPGTAVERDHARARRTGSASRRRWSSTAPAPAGTRARSPARSMSGSRAPTRSSRPPSRPRPTGTREPTWSS